MHRSKPLSKIATQWMLGMALLWAVNSAYALTCTSTAAVNNWSTVATWSGGVGNCNRVPINGDNVVISAGGTTTLDVNSNTLASLTVNGTLTIGNNNTPQTLTVTGNVTVTGTMQVNNPALATNHTLILGGNISNTGTFNMSNGNGKGKITFNNNGNQTVSGAGAYTFNLITLNMGATNANILDMQSPMTVPSPFLTITNGTYKHSNTSNITPWTADPAIPASGGFWLNANATVTTSFNVTVNGGLFRVSAGTMNIGTAADSIVLMLNNVATTLFQMDGGALNVTGGIMSGPCGACASGNEVVNAAGTFTMNGGTITLQTIDAGPVETFGLGSATTLNWSGGTIICRNGDNTTYDLDIRSGTQNVTGGTLQIGDASESAVNDFLITNQQAGGVLNVWNLVLASGNGHTVQLGSTINVLNDLTIQATKTLLVNAAGFAINIGGGNTSGVWTNNGAFTSNGDTVTFTGTSAIQAIGGTAATTFYNLTINKTLNNLTINTTPTVSNTLTFTSGDIVTGANRVILATTATIATPSSASYVVGALQKNYIAGANLSYYANTDFPVGDTNNYTPVNVTAGTTSTAGSLTVTTTSTEHPQVTTPIPSTGIDANKDIARYWTLNNSGLTLSASISATFSFAAGDVDAGANTANFIVERYDGINWNPTTLALANPLNTQVSNITPLAAGNNDFAIGEPLSGFTAVPGRFNAFETSTSANALLGRIYTKLAGAAFSLDIVSINAGKTAYGGAVANVTVQLLNSSNNTGALDANGCRPTWTAVQTLTAPTINIPASGRVTLGGITVAQAYRDVRLQISSAGPLIGCSTDRFSIRPPSFTVTSTNANITNTTGTPAIKAGTPFNLSAASVVGYDGTPSINNAMIVGTPNAGTIGGNFSAAPPATGTATGASFTYSEVGNFGFNATPTASAVYDSSFTAVDQPNDCTADFSNAPVGGKYGCSFGSPAIASGTGLGFGRFSPDHFQLDAGTPPTLSNRADLSCTPIPTFTYMGEPMQLTFRLLAQNSANVTTTNYAGAYAKLNPATPGPAFNFGALSGSTNLSARVSAVYPGATPAWSSGILDIPAANPLYVSIGRAATGPDGRYTSVQFGIAPTDSDAVAMASYNLDVDSNGIMDHTVIPVPGTTIEVRYGRIRIQNAFGSELVDLPVPMRAEYYQSATAGWITTSDDGCTTVPLSKLAPSNPITVGSKQTNASIANSPVVGGDAGLSLSKPGVGGTGYVDLTLDLTAAPWLQYDWSGTGSASNPTGRATFGIYGGNQRNIYLRERY